jgi:isocitrate lyase
VRQVERNERRPVRRIEPSPRDLAPILLANIRCRAPPSGAINPQETPMTPPERMRALLAEPGLVVMPAVWDGLSAKLSAKAGFKTAFLSGSCVAASRLGGPDLDLVSFGEMFDSFTMVHNAAPETLVLADGDHGYGNAMNVQRTVRAYGRAGAAAILIEDKITPRAMTAAGKPCLPRDEARIKIRAAIEAAKESGILVLARTDCRPTQGIDEAVARIEMFVAEGADILFLDSPADDAEIRCRAGLPVAGRCARRRLQDRNLSHRHAVARRRRHEGRACRTRRRQGGGGRRPAGGRTSRNARLRRIRPRGQARRFRRLTRAV